MSTLPGVAGSALSHYFTDIRARALLTRDEEISLAERARGGSLEALHGLIEANLSFVVKVAMEYRNLGVPFEDLLGEGNVGLIEAARRFDSRQGCKFITYAMWWIRKSILSALRRQTRLVRLPEYQVKKVQRIREAERRLEAALGRKPGRDELTAHLSQPAGDVDRTLRLAGREVSLEDVTGTDSEVRLADRLAAAGPDPESHLLRREDRDLLSDALGELRVAERTVISHRFGLEGGAPRTLSEVGKLVGLSRERVRQIENQGKKRLRRGVVRRRSMRRPAVAQGQA
jgi:RNA polymerase primary sigma factor